jgi:hypothetical protein
VNHRKGYLTAAEAARSKAAQVPGAVIEENCRCGMVHVNAPAVPLDPDRNSGPPAAVRALCLARDGHACVCCGISVIGRPRSLGHRLRASQQGKPVPSNLLTYLGLGVNSLDPDDHHARIDSRGDPSDEAKGYTVRSWQNPLLVPVMLFGPHGSGMTLWPDDLGNYLTEPPDGLVAA